MSESSSDSDVSADVSCATSRTFSLAFDFFDVLLDMALFFLRLLGAKVRAILRKGIEAER